MDAVLTEICRVLGLPVPQQRERRFLVEHVRSLPPSAVTTRIEQVHLARRHPEVERRIRRVVQTSGLGRPGGLYVYTERQVTADGQRLTRERTLSGAKEYQALLAERDPTRAPLIKERTSFVWADQYFQLDRTTGPRGVVELLEVELTEQQPAPVLPPFVRVGADVSEDPAYRNAALAAETDVG
jgi:hypothetical protein